MSVVQTPCFVVDEPDVPGADNDVTALAHDEYPITALTRDHLTDIVVEWSLVKHTPIPTAASALQRGEPVTATEAAALSAGWYQIAMEWVSGTSSSWDVSQLWKPIAEPHPFVVVVDQPPIEWFRYIQFGDEDGFREACGARSCTECPEVFDEQHIECPECGVFLEAVQNNLEGLQEEHPGVLLAIDSEEIVP